MIRPVVTLGSVCLFVASAAAQPAGPASQPTEGSASRAAATPASQPVSAKPSPAPAPAVPQPASPPAGRAGEVTSIEQLSLEELLAPIKGASRYEQKQADAPSAVSVIDADEIARYGYRTLGEILESLRGVYLTDDRNYSYLGVRGFGIPGDYNSRVLLLVDGQRTNDSLYDTAAVDGAFVLDVDSIERVEFIRGPSSSIYGSNAFFGVINVITRTGKTHKGPAASLELGSLGSQRLALRYGDAYGPKQRPVEMFLSATYARSHGQRFLHYPEFEDTSSGIARDADGEERGSFYGGVSWAGLSLSGAFTSRVKHVPTAAYGTVFNDPRFVTEDSRGYVALAFERTLAGITLNARASYNTYYYDGEYPYDYREDPADPPLLTINRDEAWGQWWGLELHLSRQFFDQLKISLGAELRHSFRQDQKNFDVDPPYSYLDLEDSTKLVGLYGQADWRKWSWLALSAGVRYDNYFGDVGGRFNPRLAGIFTPVQGTNIKLLFGTAFRAASAYERFYASGDPEVGDAYLVNPDLKSETIQTYEVVLEQALGRHARAVLSGYYYRLDDLIQIQVVDEELSNSMFENVGDVDALGLELELAAHWRKLHARGSFALQKAKDRETGDELTNSPRVLTKLNLSVPLYADKLFASIWARYMTARLNRDRELVAGQVLIDLSLLTRELVRGLSISATVKNLLDLEYFDPASAEHLQPQLQRDRRTFWLKLTYQYSL